MTESANIQRQRLLTESNEAWVELWELRYDESGGNGAFITANPEPVTLAGVTYSPFPIGRATIERNLDSNNTEITVAICNVDLFMAGIARDLGGTTAILRIANTAYLSSLADVREYRFTVKDVAISDITAELRMSVPNPLEFDFPSERCNRTRCAWLAHYGGTECGYDTTRSGALSTCDGTLDGPNGCTAHGADEAAAGKPRKHPLRFGGFPSILKGPYA